MGKQQVGGTVPYIMKAVDPIGKELLIYRLYSKIYNTYDHYNYSYTFILHLPRVWREPTNSNYCKWEQGE